MAKAIKVALESSGATYNTLPGSTGDLNREGAQLDDTIFGRDFSSSEPGLINWNVSANGFYKGGAGYLAKIVQGGASTAFSGEPMSEVTDHPEADVYQVDLSSDSPGVDISMWDRDVLPTFYDAASQLVPADYLWIDYLHGRVRLAAAPGGDMTVDGNYLVQADVGKANSFSLTQNCDVLDITDFTTAQGNNGFNVFIATLLSASLELGSFYDLTNAFFAALKDRSELIIEIDPLGDGLSIARGYFKMVTDNQTGDVGGDETESVTFALSVPEGLTQPPLSWVHDPTSTLSQAIQDILTQWAAKTALSLQYLPDGLVGFQGDAFVTEASLAGGVDAMNEFSFAFQGSGELIEI